jgi:DNA-binding MarR family transcriptional regulator
MMLNSVNFAASNAEPSMQGNFQNEYHHLRANLLRIGAWLRQEVNTVLEPFGITQQQFNALRILRGQMNVVRSTSFSTNDLRDLLLDKSADTSRLVDRLVDKGYVLKAPCTIDSRRVNLKLSETGLQLLSEIDQKMSEMDAILGNVSEKEARELNGFLDRLLVRSDE